MGRVPPGAEAADHVPVDALSDRALCRRVRPAGDTGPDGPCLQRRNGPGGSGPDGRAIERK